MGTQPVGGIRPPIHLLASESDLVASLALRAEHRQPVVAAMLLEEIERAELHDADTMPAGHVMLNSHVAFVDEKTQQMREVRLVMPAEANIAEGRVSILTPMGAAIYSWIKTGTLHAEGSSITEGIGQGRVTANLEGAPIDDAFQIPDEEALPIIFDLLEHEGLCMGGSTGINIAGAIRMAKQIGPGHTIVTILCDYGTRYQSKLFNPEFLRSKNLPVPHWLVDKREAIKVPYES